MTLPYTRSPFVAHPTRPVVLHQPIEVPSEILALTDDEIQDRRRKIIADTELLLVQQQAIEDERARLAAQIMPLNKEALRRHLPGLNRL
jgi:hypothetical protein